MWDQEKQHLKKFQEILPKYRVRPTALLPFWNIAGFTLGEKHLKVRFLIESIMLEEKITIQCFNLLDLTFIMIDL